ncbi:MAG: CBS domain-containing protein [Pseudomonadota bacterium]
MEHRIVPDVVHGQDLTTVAASATAREAAQLMATRHIGAVLVVEGGALHGIFTERDLAIKVVAAGLDPDRVSLSQVMTRNPQTIGPSETVHGALDLMTRGGYRHLPVVDKGGLVGLVSIRDLYAIVLHELEDDLKDLDAFIHGTGYSPGG